MNSNVLPEGYEVVEVSDGCGGYEYEVQKIEDDFDWCNDSGYSDVFADLDAQDSKWGEYKI